MKSLPYRERVLPHLGTFLLPLLLAIMFFAMFLPINELLALSVGAIAAAVLGAVLIAKAPVIFYNGETLRVGRASIRREHLGKVEALDPEESFAAKGHLLDARAYTCFQSSLRTLVRVEITDPEDPTPYWLFTTRHAKELVSLLA